MSFGGNTASVDPRVVELRHAFQQGMTRFFMGFAVTEGIVLAAAVVVIWVLRLIDPGVGVYIVLGIAVVGGFTLFLTIQSRSRRLQRDIRDITGVVAGG